MLPLSVQYSLNYFIIFQTWICRVAFSEIESLETSLAAILHNRKILAKGTHEEVTGKRLSIGVIVRRRKLFD